MKRKQGKWMLVPLVLFILFFSGCGKTELDQMVGTWQETDGSRGFRFYKPDGSETGGDAEYMKGESTYYGTYEWHESSKRIVVTVEDNWGSMDSMSFDYEFSDKDHLVLTQTEDSDAVVELVRTE